MHEDQQQRQQRQRQRFSQERTCIDDQRRVDRHDDRRHARHRSPKCGGGETMHQQHRQTTQERLGDAHGPGLVSNRHVDGGQKRRINRPDADFRRARHVQRRRPARALRLPGKPAGETLPRRQVPCDLVVHPIVANRRRYLRVEQHEGEAQGERGRQHERQESTIRCHAAVARRAITSA